MTQKTKHLCQGCGNDYYNHHRDKGCWLFGKAKVVERQRVGTWQHPPYSWEPETRLSCYRAEGYSMLPRTDQRIVEA